MNKYLLIIIILGICFGTFNAGLTQTSLAQTSSDLTQDLTQEGDEITMVKKGIENWIETLKSTFREGLAIWKDFHQKAMNWWKSNILPKLQTWYEKKKPEIETEFKKEKKEMEQEIGKILSNSWQWLKDLIKSD